MKKYFVLVLFLFACSDKPKDSFELGKRAYDSGKFIKARKFFMQVDTVGQWSDQAKKYLSKIDSLAALTYPPSEETTAQKLTYDDKFFTEQNLLLETSQYQLIGRTCALYLNTPDERREIKDSIKWAYQSSDTSENSSEDEQDAGGDDAMFYQDLYEEQFETLKKLGIDTVRVQNKRYVRFIDKNKKIWTLANKEGAFFDDGMVLFNVDTVPMQLYLKGWGSDEIKKYFSTK